MGDSNTMIRWAIIDDTDMGDPPTGRDPEDRLSIILDTAADRAQDDADRHNRLGANFQTHAIIHMAEYVRLDDTATAARNLLAVWDRTDGGTCRDYHSLRRAVEDLRTALGGAA